jgi:hypothetical protein
MHLQSQNVSGQAGLLIGRDQLVRLSPNDQEAAIDMDDYLKAVAMLPHAAKRVVAESQAHLRPFFVSQALPAPAFHGPRATQDPAGPR